MRHVFVAVAIVVGKVRLPATGFSASSDLLQPACHFAERRVTPAQLTISLAAGHRRGKHFASADASDL
jgi:hypothetical protein